MEELVEMMKAKITLALARDQEKKDVERIRIDEKRKRKEERITEQEKEARIAEEEWNEKRRVLLFKFLEAGRAPSTRMLKYDMNCKTMDETHWSAGKDPGIAYQRQIDSGAYADVFQVLPPSYRVTDF
jgi:hypothetical protein